MKPTVYYSKNNFNKILDKLPGDLKGKVGIKVHVGEMGNVTYLKPKYAEAVYNKLSAANKDVSLIECNVLYRGSRTNRKDHLETAKKHGYDFAKLDILDGDFGEKSWEIKINQKHFKTILVGERLKKYDNIVCLSHFKGHSASGFGGALKNLGMGLGSRAGKMAMHAAFDLKIDPEICIGCGICAAKCDFEAIDIDKNKKAKINFKKCKGCAGCIANCPQGAVIMPWGDTSSEGLQERIVEHCYGIIKNINCPVYINVLENITARCDCAGVKLKPISPDLGYLISSDPVAIDQASHDLVVKELKKDPFGKSNKIDSLAQLQYAEKLGLGRTGYLLINI